VSRRSFLKTVGGTIAVGAASTALPGLASAAEKASGKPAETTVKLLHDSLTDEQRADKFDDKALAELAPVAPHLAWVDLARSKVTDAGLATVGKMAALERLHLENTAITDAGLAQLEGLSNLEYLNLYGTKVTDAGIAKLAANKALKKLFVWQTGVTKDGAKKLETAVPGLVVNVGLSEAEITKLIEAAKPPAPPAPEAKKEEKKPEPPKPAAATPAKADARPAPAPKADPAKPAATATPAPKPAEAKKK
jgi:hypothetical protein